MAFYDPAASGRVACRAYLVTAGQFADVIAQEMRRPAGDDFARTLAKALFGVKTAQVLGPASYETVIRLGEQEEAPLLTVTVDASRRPPLAAPSLPRLDRSMMRRAQADNLVFSGRRCRHARRTHHACRRARSDRGVR
jgi:hypothetical protein